MSRIGLICSGGGAVMSNAFDLLAKTGFEPDWAVVTDRPCGTEEKTRERGIPLNRINYSDCTQFSVEAGKWLFNDMECDLCVLLITRLIGPEVFAAAPCVNIHPSLLPLFPGLGALEATINSEMRVMGATAHRVDCTTDGGSILAQVWSATPGSTEMIRRVSFAQKLYLMLWACREFSDDTVVSNVRCSASVTPSWAQPSFSDSALFAAFLDFVKLERIPWPQ